MRVKVVSDVHIGSNGSRFHNNPELEEELLDHLRNTDYVVINGDFLDILLGSPRAYYAPGEERDSILERGRNLINKRLRPIIDACPNTRFIYIDGNHETGDLRQAEFISELFTELGNDYPERFFWRPKAIRIADFLITHSHDYINGTTAREPEVLCPILEHKITLDYNLQGITGIIMGHTHKIFHGFDHNGIKYYNTGSFFKRDAGILLELEINGDLQTGTVTQVTQLILKKDVINSLQHA